MWYKYNFILQPKFSPKIKFGCEASWYPLLHSLQLYPYHLQDMLVQGLRVTPFGYYCNMMYDTMLSEKSYDSLPNFTAADCESVDSSCSQVSFRNQPLPPPQV